MDVHKDNDMQHWQEIIQQISQSTGKKFQFLSSMAVGGGCINAASIINGTLDNKPVDYFVKTSRPGNLSMFKAEAAALEAIAQSHTIRVPVPLCCGEDSQQSFIVMASLSLVGQANQYQLARQLAAMHDVTAKQFGWHINNTIGATRQVNTPTQDWLVFWAEQRLGFQLRLAAANGYSGRLQTLGERMLVKMADLFQGRTVSASMLHGDLWGGNVAGLADGTPVIFDPAFYYGDYEAELAMSELFGGFSTDFYAAYREIRPEEDGYALRRSFYNSYHIINHLNMFGGAYHARAINMLESVLAQI